MMRIDPNRNPVPFLGLAADSGSNRRAYLSAVTAGLYKNIVMAVFSPPLIRLKGKKTGRSNSATASLEQPM